VTPYEVVIVNDKMQKGYRYELMEPMGSNFYPGFQPELTPAQMLRPPDDSRSWFQWYCGSPHARRRPDADKILESNVAAHAGDQTTLHAR
jgi:hypothetical protein